MNRKGQAHDCQQCPTRLGDFQLRCWFVKTAVFAAYTPCPNRFIHDQKTNFEKTKRP